MGDADGRIFLEIVRRQIILGGDDKRFEEPPGSPARLCARNSRVVGRERAQPAPSRLAEPPGDRRAKSATAPTIGAATEDRPDASQIASSNTSDRRWRAESTSRRKIRRSSIAARPLGIARGAPFQQLAPRDQHAPRRARDRVEADIGVVRQASQSEYLLQQSAGRRVRPTQSRVLARRADRRAAAPDRPGRQNRRQQPRCRARPACKAAPPPGRNQPRISKRQQRRGNEAAAQIVENLPARKAESGFATRLAIGAGHARQQPRRDLPVAANPAMAPADVGRIAAGYSSNSITSLTKPERAYAPSSRSWLRIAVFRQASADGFAQGVDVVDPLADERAFLKNILIDVGDGARVGIDARLAGEEAGEPRAAGAGHADADARLKNAVALGDPAALSSKIGRFSGCAIVPTSCRAASRGSCVSLSSVMTYFNRRQTGRSADDRVEFVLVPRRTRVKFFELAALALPSHPDAFLGIPPAGAMKEEKAAVRFASWHHFRRAFRGVFSIECVDSSRACSAAHRPPAVSPAAASRKSVSRAKCR